MFKKVFVLVLALLMCASISGLFASCSGNADSGDKADVKIGVILLGDETEGYTLAHINGIKKAAAAVGIPEDRFVWAYNVGEDKTVTDKAIEMIGEDCNLIISNSYGHQDFMYNAAKDYPNVHFAAATGDFGAICGLPNLYNAFTRVYESRYVSGVVAGMKLKEMIANTKNADYTGEDVIKPENMDENGNIKVGYVGAFPYDEVVSGYTAFFLGIQSIVPNVVMEVEYTKQWFHIEKEGASAKSLMSKNCVIIGQHADSTGAPAAVEAAHNDPTGPYHNVYSIGYNISMLDTAPHVALTSATNEWSVYYEALFRAEINGEAIPQDFAKGYADGGVGITALGSACAPGTAEEVARVEAALKDGTLKVFDCSKFTVDGKHITSNIVDFSYMDFVTMTPIYVGEKKETLKTENGVTYFDESTLRAAPYFSIRIDGITETGK